MDTNVVIELTIVNYNPYILLLGIPSTFWKIENLSFIHTISLLLPLFLKIWTKLHEENYANEIMLDNTLHLKYDKGTIISPVSVYWNYLYVVCYWLRIIGKRSRMPWRITSSFQIQRLIFFVILLQLSYTHKGRKVSAKKYLILYIICHIVVRYFQLKRLLDTSMNKSRRSKKL